MDFFDVLAKRRSVRGFEAERPVSAEDEGRLLEAACQAPSAGNVQPWRFFAVTSPDMKAKLMEAALGQPWVGEAPLVIVACADLSAHDKAYGRRGVELYSIQDVAAAVENILLAATALGLGSCWVGAFKESKVAEALGLPRDVRPLAMVPIGYIRGDLWTPPKTPPSDITTHID